MPIKIQVRPGQQVLLSGPWHSRRWASKTADRCFVTVQSPVIAALIKPFRLAKEAAQSVRWTETQLQQC